MWHNKTTVKKMIVGSIWLFFCLSGYAQNNKPDIKHKFVKELTSARRMFIKAIKNTDDPETMSYWLRAADNEFEQSQVDLPKLKKSLKKDDVEMLEGYINKTRSNCEDVSWLSADGSVAMFMVVDAIVANRVKKIFPSVAMTEKDVKGY